MKVEKTGRYKHLTESLVVVNKNNDESYEFVSHIYAMDNGKGFVEYEKIKSKKSDFFKEMESGKNN